MDSLRDKILDLLKDEVKSILSYDDIKYFLNINASYTDDEINLELESLVKDNIIYKNKKNKYGLLQSFNLYIGKLYINRRGVKFFVCDEFKDNIMISDRNDDVLPNDKVLAHVLFDGEKRYAKLEQIIERASIVCTVLRNSIYERGYHLECNELSEYYIECSDNLNEYNVGDFLKCEVIEVINSSFKRIKVKVKGLISKDDDKDKDILLLLDKYEIDSKFSDDVIKESKALKDNYNLAFIKEAQRRKRIDDLIITIDGEDAKDLDDAVSLKINEKGNFVLGVYIADVSFFVREGSLIDNEALKRGTSVYFPSKVIPMLPFVLSNDLCSLNPNEDKLVLGIEMEIDKFGNVLTKDIFDAIIRTKFRMTYDEVSMILDGKYAPKHESVVPMIKNMNQLKEILKRKRSLRGSLDFNTIEPKIICDENNNVIDINLRKNRDSENIIEEFMICANEEVAQSVRDLDLPFIYRIHDEPNQEKLNKIMASLKNHNLSLKRSGRGKTFTKHNLQSLLNEVNTKDMIISSMLVRIMAKAKYSKDNIGHYGLASACYTHFTSPIRRYPDLLVHRLVRQYIIEGSIYSDFDNDKEIGLSKRIEEIAKISSDAEIRANKCEFEARDMYMAKYMEAHLFETFEGIISSVTSFGMYVTLDNGVEGLVLLRDLEGYFTFDSNNLTLSNIQKGITYRLGDKIKVICVDANPDAREVIFKVYKTRKN